MSREPNSSEAGRKAKLPQSPDTANRSEKRASLASSKNKAERRSPVLTKVELQIIFLMFVEGKTNKEIAALRGVSVSAVNHAEERLLLKFGARNGKQLGYLARNYLGM